MEDGAILHRVRPRWRDLDAYGHVNHAVFLTYFEEGRDRWLKGLGLVDLGYAVARVELDLKREITADSEVGYLCRTARVGRTSVVTEERLVDRDGTTLAAGRFVIVVWDKDRGCPREPTPQERDALTGSLPGNAGTA